MNHGYFPQDHSDCDARIAELEAEVTQRANERNCYHVIMCEQRARIEELEAEAGQYLGRLVKAAARLTAVIALCDHGAFYELREKVRAAATGDTT